MALEGPLDIVTLIGVLEHAAMYWRRAGEPHEEIPRFALENLSPDGVLVVAIESKLGMKYFSGCTEDHLSKPFPGIEGYPDPGGPHTFGRQELVDLATRSGFTVFEVLLPFPDYKLPSALINGRSTSARECIEYNLVDWCRERFRDCTCTREHPFSDQLALWSVAKTGLMADLSNSFPLLAARGRIRRSGAPPWARRSSRDSPPGGSITCAHMRSRGRSAAPHRRRVALERTGAHGLGAVPGPVRVLAGMP